jgi:non-lysosomal glucosylceramidase
VASRLAELEAATVNCVRSVVETAAPLELREAALFNLSTLRSPTVFRTAAGDYYGWEGVGDRAGSCYGTCTHVWGYEFATSLLFAPIARSFRHTQFARCTDDAGLMSFRAGLPLDKSQSWGLAAADGQLACIVHLYLDWMLSGDQSLLTELWPAARRALEFCWIPGGWDADRDGVMEGVQHNTMDVEYFGPNPQMGSWYLAALRAAEEMSAAAGDAEFASYCHKLFESGSGWLDDNLFNGSYYRHEVRPVLDADEIAPGLRHRSMGSADTAHPDLQLADGCLVDQLVGQYAATLTGLGDLLDPDHVRSALQAVRTRNFRPSFAAHFNHMRSFVLGDEAGVLMCTYDQDRRPERPFPYFNEVMTGFEYTAATGLLQVGELPDGLEIIRAIRARYDGARRNPFDEAECGHHYARAMASWSAFATWNDISYSGVSATLSVGADKEPGQRFWSTGSACGTWLAGQDGGGTLEVIAGRLPLRHLELGGQSHEPPAEVLSAGASWTVGSAARRP